MNKLLSKEFYQTLAFKGEHKRQPDPNRSIANQVVTKPRGQGITLFNRSQTQVTLYDNEVLYFSAHNTICFYTHIELSGTTTFNSLIPLAECADDGVTCELMYLGDVKLTDVKEWIEQNAKKFKIRLGQSFHIKKLFAMVTAMLQDFAEKDKESKGTDKAVEVRLDQQKMKEYLTSCNTETIYIYETETLGDKTFAEMNRLILECYAVQENSKLNSCMTKSGGDWTRIGADYSSYSFPQCFNDGVWIHPFQAYNTCDWKFAFASKHAPEKVLNWEQENKSPFIARAILNDYSNGKGEWRINDGTICYGAREIVDSAYLAMYQSSSSRYCSSIRLYRNDNDDVIMPYVDGNDQTAGDLDSYENIVHDGVELTYTIGEIGQEYDTIWESTGGYAIADTKQRYEFCEILCEDINADDAVWISAINGYVHSDFATSDGEIDGLALFRYVR